MKEKILEIANHYAATLKKKVDTRVVEIEADDMSHFLIYQVLGVGVEEGKLIDIYQNKGRFLYRYAGAFLEQAVKMCFQEKYPDAKTSKIDNTQGRRPKQFEIYIVEESAKLGIEIKWRDATTDGDHITKEHTRVLAVKDAGYKPVRVMFYYPNREQAMRIQRALASLYRDAGGEYYSGDDAWAYVKEMTDVDLLAILSSIAEQRV